jgi:hypothetical protein
LQANDVVSVRAGDTQCRGPCVQRDGVAHGRGAEPLDEVPALFTACRVVRFQDELAVGAVPVNPAQ